MPQSLNTKALARATRKKKGCNNEIKRNRLKFSENRLKILAYLSRFGYLFEPIIKKATSWKKKF